MSKTSLLNIILLVLAVLPAVHAATTSEATALSISISTSEAGTTLNVATTTSTPGISSKPKTTKKTKASSTLKTTSTKSPKPSSSKKTKTKSPTTSQTTTGTPASTPVPPTVNCTVTSDCTNNTNGATICFLGTCTVPANMSDPLHCGGDPNAPGRNCSTIGSYECFGGVCVLPDCAVKSNTTDTTVNFIISNSSVVSGYLIWVDPGTGYPLDIASTFKLPLNHAMVYSASTTLPGFYDLATQSLGLYVTYNPDTSYITFNSTSSEGSSVWRPDPCSGTMKMNFRNQPYQILVDSDKNVFAETTTHKELAGMLSQRNTITTSGPSRCAQGNPAQKIPLDDPRLKPNGCGTLDGISSLVPNYHFKSCCDGHDTCYSDCSQSYDTCNSNFNTCMNDVCAAIPPGINDAQGMCYLAAAIFTKAVSSVSKPFLDATAEACDPCPDWDTSTRCGVSYNGELCWCADYFCDWCECGWPADY